MKKQYAWLLAAIIAVMLAASVYARPSSLEILLLSDHDVTGHDPYHASALRLTSTTTSSNAHVFWTEWTDDEEERDVFYRQLPDGSTIRLSDAAISEGFAFNPKIASAPNGKVCAAWEESANDVEENDVFYWDSETRVTLRLSIPELSSSTPDVIHVLCNDERSDVLWVEYHPDVVDGWGKEVFYWSSTTGETRVISNLETQDGVSSDEEFFLQNGVMHVVWNEWVDDVEVFHHFYWNDASNSVVDLGPSEPRDNDLVVDSSGVAHTFWIDEDQVKYWNSETADTVILDPSGEVIRSAVDDMGRVHAVWKGGGLNYWNTTMAEPTIVGNSEGFLRTTLFTVGSTAHAIWGDGDYWDSETQEVVDLNSLGSGSVHSTLIEWRVDDAGTVHFAWGQEQENDVWYWNSRERMARSFSAPVTEGMRISQLAMAISDGGQAHLAWMEEVTENRNGATIYYAATSDEEATTKITTTTYDIGALQMVVDGVGMPHVGWVDSGWNGEYLEYAIYHWHPETGVTPLTAHEHDVGPFELMRDESGVVYATWDDRTEGEDLDAFAAIARPIVPSGYSNKVYLPMLQQ